MEVRSTLTCPKCAHVETEMMPTNACQFFYDCKGCGAVLRPNAGDCCVYCSFGSVPCPPIQEARATGGVASCCQTGASGVTKSLNLFVLGVGMAVVSEAENCAPRFRAGLGGQSVARGAPRSP